VNQPPLDNAKVRRALSLAIDREGIVRSAYSGAREPAANLVPPGCGGYISDTRIPTDYAAACRLLAEAGFPDGKGLPTMAVLFPFLGSESEKTVQILQETWRRELGVQITVESMETKMWLQNKQTGNFTISFGGWSADFADPANFLEIYLSNGGNNITGWANPDYDQLIKQASRMLDTERRLELFQTAEALLLEEKHPLSRSFLQRKPTSFIPRSRTGNQLHWVFTVTNTYGWTNDLQSRLFARSEFDN
jgi:oligopeptide transport system substrate-binding protein